MNRDKGSYKVLIILAVGCLLALAIFLLRPTPKTRTVIPDKPPLVSITKVVLQDYQVQVSTQGTVRPSRQIQLVAEVSGRVLSVNDNFTDGGFIQPQDVLVSLDERDYRYRLVEAQAQVAIAKRELALEKGQARQAKREWRDLGSREANALSLRQPQVEAAKAQLASANAQQRQAQLNLERATIRAPFRGRILSTQVDVGQYVTAGQQIAEIYDATLAEVRLSLTDKQVGLIGLPLGIAFDKTQQPNVMLSTQIAGQRYQWPAKLVRTEASVDTSTRFYIAVVEIPEPFDLTRYASPLVMGSFVDAHIDGVQYQQVLRVPEKALLKNQWVFVVGDDGVLQQRKVAVLNKEGSHFWVKGAVQQGEALVVSTPKILNQGMVVTRQWVDHK